jgi:CO/xanthine dehydrogenase Mo-binding subunit
MSEKFSVVGKPVPKLDAVKLATGRAEFLDDLRLPGALAVKLLGSTCAHARIKRIDVSRAERYPGVRGVVTFKDSPRVPYNPGVYYLEPRTGTSLTRRSAMSVSPWQRWRRWTKTRRRRRCR